MASAIFLISSSPFAWGSADGSVGSEGEESTALLQNVNKFEIKKMAEAIMDEVVNRLLNEAAEVVLRED